MRAYLFITLLMGPMAWASSGHEEGIPLQMIFFQALNLTIIVGVIAYFTHKKIRAYFADRAALFHSAAERAERAIQAAQTEKRVITEQLQQLQASAQAEVTRARKEAEELRHQIIREGEVLSNNLRQDAERTVKQEMNKARMSLRDEFLARAMTTAQATLSHAMAEPDQRRLQTEFVEKIQVVGQ